MPFLSKRKSNIYRQISCPPQAQEEVMETSLRSSEKHELVMLDKDGELFRKIFDLAQKNQTSVPQSTVVTVRYGKNYYRNKMIDAAAARGTDSMPTKITISAEDAKMMVRNGTYGFCFECGKKIPEDQLRAEPLAVYCDSPECEDQFRRHFPKLFLQFSIRAHRFSITQAVKKLECLRLAHGEAIRSPEINERSDFHGQIVIADQHLHRLVRELSGLLAAVEKYNHDKYGICVKCDGKISDDRLILIPWSDTCIECIIKQRTLH